MSAPEAELLEAPDVDARALTVRRDADLALRRAPDVVLEEAHRAAKALKDVLDKKPHKVLFNEEPYLEFEDWQTVGRFYGVTAKEDGDPEFVQYGEVRGFKASAVALDAAGEVRSRATAYCLSDEEKWRSRPKYAWCYVTKSGERVEQDPGPDRIVWEPNPNKPGKNRPKKERTLVGEEPVPLFQLASMAQTRANAKVLRNVLAWVVVLAGYRPTPAEELDAQVVPVAPEPAPPTDEQLADLEALIETAGANKEELLRFFKIKKLSHITPTDLTSARRMLEAKIQKARGK